MFGEGESRCAAGTGVLAAVALRGWDCEAASSECTTRVSPTRVCPKSINGWRLVFERVCASGFVGPILGHSRLGAKPEGLQSDSNLHSPRSVPLAARFQRA